MQRTLVTLSIFFSLGVAIGLLEERSSFFVLLFLITTLFLGSIFFFCLFTKRVTYTGIASALFLFLALGVFRGGMYEEKRIADEYLGKQTFKGEVITPSVQKDTTQVFVVRIQNTETKIQVTTPLFPEYEPGMIVTISGVVKEGEVLLPKEEGRQSFDYGQYLEMKDIVGTIFYPKIEVNDERVHALTYKLFSIKEKSLNALQTHIPFPESMLTAGVLLGVDALPKENKDAMKVSSLTHITVLSGFNIAIIIGAVLYLLRFLPLSVKVSVSALLITFFVIMVGGGASLIRATLMGYVALLALFLGRRYDALTALFFALFVYLLITPQALLYDVSLQLSFLATLGIILLYQPLETYLKEKVKNTTIVGIVATTFAVILYTTPFLMYTFGTVSLYGLFANMLVLPLVPLLMLFGFFTICFSFIPFVSTAVAFISYILSSTILLIAEKVSSLPFASISVTISLTTMICIYVVILFMTYRLLHKKEEIVVHESGAISF